MSGRHAIGVDTGGTKLLGGVVEEGLVVRHRVRRTWGAEAGAEKLTDRAHVLETMVDAVEEARAASASDPPVAVGFGIPALVDFERGHAISSVHLPLDDLPFRDLMSERLGLPVVVDNDANLAALAEQRYGAAQGASHVVLLTIGTGIGGGLILDGRPYRGATGAGAELGHVVVDMDGPRCFGGCPNRGCLEAVASGTAIGREGAAAAAREPGSELGRAAAGGRTVTGALVTELAAAGDPAARSVLSEVGRRLGAGISGLVNAFEPEVVVVGGGAMAAGELLLEPAREEVAARALPPGRDRVRIVPTHFGEEAGMVGAGVLALEEAG